MADRLAVASARIDELSAEVNALRRARSAELGEREARIAQLEAALMSAREAAASAAAPDDLKRIKGIGPAIEALLHGLGITTFRQLADLSAEDRSRVGDLLGLFRGRIEQDQWVEQARALVRAAGSA